MDRVGITVAPGDVEPALGALGEALERVTVDCVDRHPSARRHDTDDAIPGKWVAATGKMQRHARDQPADRDRHLVAFRSASCTCQRYDLRLGFLGMWEGGVNDCASGSQPLANRDIKILDGRAVKILQHGLERPLRELLALLAERLLYDCPPEIEI